MNVRSPVDEAARSATVAEYDLGELSGATDLEAAVRLAAHVCGTPAAAINVITAREQRRLAAVGSDIVGIQAADCARTDSPCAISINEAGPVVVPDTLRDPRFAGNPFVTGALGRMRFYAAGLLRAPDGQVIGTLCVYDLRERTLTPDQRDRLDDLARLVVDVLELHRRTGLLRGALQAVHLTGHELERSHAGLTRFAEQVTHDVRNPLGRIRGLLGHLAASPGVVSDPEAVHLVTRATAAADRMNTVINGVLEQMPVGEALDLGRVELGTVVGEVLDDLESEIRAARARVTVGRLPTVTGDATLLRTVMHNLVANTLRYRHPRRLCKVHITGERVESGWVIRVADNGVGIAPEHRYAALQPFSRPPARGGAGPDGPGIGLATCRRIIEAHQGDIVLEDTPGGGTTVVFHLPLRDVPAQVAGRPLHKTGRAPGSNVSVSGREGR